MIKYRDIDNDIDISSITIEDSFYCATKWKISHADQPLYLMLCGNDVLERTFGNFRLKNSSMDNLELIFCARNTELCTNMQSKHPEWYKGRTKIMRRLCLDYSNTPDWNAENLKLANVDLIAVYNQGRAKAELLLNKIPKYSGRNCDFASFAAGGCTFKIPDGKTMIGVSLIDIESISEESIEYESEEVNSIHDLVQNNSPHDPQIEVDGAIVFKATVVKNLFSANPLSKDRLGRIKDYSRIYQDDPELNNNTSMDSTIMPGDPILAKTKETIELYVIKSIRKANEVCKFWKALL